MLVPSLLDARLYDLNQPAPKLDDTLAHSRCVGVSVGDLARLCQREKVKKDSTYFFFNSSMIQNDDQDDNA